MELSFNHHLEGLGRTFTASSAAGSNAHMVVWFSFPSIPLSSALTTITVKDIMVKSVELREFT